MLGRVLGESVPPGSFVSRDGVVGGGGAVAAESRGKATPRLFTRVRKTGAQGRSGQPPHRHPKAARRHFCPCADNLKRWELDKHGLPLSSKMPPRRIIVCCMRKVSLLFSIPSWRPLLPFIGRPWSKRHPACLYMYTSPPIADNAIHLSLGLLAGTPHQAFSTKPHRRPRHPSMNRLNCHQNRYLPGGRANVRLGSRHAGESGTDTRLLPRVLLIQSPHTIPSYNPVPHILPPCDLGESRHPSAKRRPTTPPPPFRYATPGKA